LISNLKVLATKIPRVFPSFRGELPGPVLSLLLAASPSTVGWLANSLAKSPEVEMSVSLTYQDVAEHNTKKDCYVVIHDTIYDATKFIDEHP
jgi:hypothetical protein